MLLREYVGYINFGRSITEFNLWIIGLLRERSCNKLLGQSSRRQNRGEIEGKKKTQTKVSIENI
jgi:hypothetical protein